MVMKKLFLTVMMVAATGTLCFAQTDLPTKKTAAAREHSKSVAGKVDAVIVGNLTQGVPSKFVITDATGAKMEIVLSTATLVYDNNMKKIPLDNVKVGQDVKAQYNTGKDGSKEAVVVFVK